MLKALFFVALLLQDPVPNIEFPEGMRPPAPQIEETPEPPPVDAFAVDELYLIQADSGLHIIPSPSGIVQVTSAQSGSVVFSKFAGGQGLEERQITRQHGYILRGLQPGNVELLVLPAGSQDLSGLRRRTLTIKAATPTPDTVQPMPLDDVSVAFVTYERAWRAAQKDLADRLDRGEITSEQQAADWFEAANKEMRRMSFGPLFRSEAVIFGGEKWTPKAHADYIRRYSSAGK